jgi:ribosomal-protein-alanine N-acetyltransferase
MQRDITTLKTERLVLRPFAETDAEAMHRIFHGKDVLRYFPPGEPPSLDKVKAAILRWLDHWTKHGIGLWAVEEIEPGELLGRCGFQVLEETGETEIDFLLAPSGWGLGYATEAARAVLHHGFDVHELQEIIALVHPDNLASRKVTQKIGMGGEKRASYFGMNCYRYVLARKAYLAQQAL